MSALPSIGGANGVDAGAAPEADLTRALYERHARQIFRYCAHQLGSREEAEDAVQSTFLNAFRGIRRGVVPDSESAWLLKIAQNVCLTRRRSSWRRGRIESPADFAAVEELAQSPALRADELIGLRDVLERMPEQQRRAILLREWQGLSYREIGEALELSQAAVETLIFRARRSLAQGLESPAEPRRRKRLAAGAFGSLVTAAQSFLAGGGAVKVAAVVAVAGAGGVVATVPVHERHAPPPAPKQVVVRVHHAVPAPRQAAPHATPPAPVAPPRHRGGRHAAAPPSRRHAAPGLAKKKQQGASAPTSAPVALPPGHARKAAAVSSAPRGRAKKAVVAPVAHGRRTPPGRLRKQVGTSPPAAPAAPAAAHGNGKGHLK